ncbi:MAG: hypothetical protein A2V88_16620 [Elusimicrobia bacterium RBG_16_66_12]|nr:MAG: hypothetical protein A2V88_16620 [Elusimicrobia bacterium RBG_16_66_12]
MKLEVEMKSLVPAELIERRIYLIRGHKVMAETADWMSQFATSNRGILMGMRRPPYVFTEHGTIMLASVLNSQIAVNASIQVVRAFVRLRELVATHKELARKFSELEHRVESHDTHIQPLFDAIRELMEPPKKPAKKIGFQTSR